MRKLLFLVLSGGIVLLGCKKNGGGDASIVGTWNVNQIVVQSYLNGNLLGGDTTTAGSVKFESDGNFTAIDEDNATTTGTYTYNSSNKQLGIISGGDTTNVTVTRLTSNNLHFTEDETADVGGNTSRVTVDADYGR